MSQLQFPLWTVIERAGWSTYALSPGRKEL
jgi:hypothetical protein